ncbi:MAG TPA: UPF0280 family protein [Xanthobacteraceae bacterium]|nr:UPF0280 family protein [Xanthobacteraceae bacterium]
MRFEPPVIQELSGGRLHFQHGPIDIVLQAWGEAGARAAAYAAAAARFRGVLDELVGELTELRKPMAERPCVTGPVARRMVAACAPCAEVFVTPMAAVAGAVADELMATMLAAAPLAKAFVNDGGDIAIHLGDGETISVGVAADFSRARDPEKWAPVFGERSRATNNVPALSGNVVIRAEDRIGGIATSGRQGRSFSLGIADSVTVLARDAASADAAATLVANAVDIDAPAVTRHPARELDPDSDLGDRLVTIEVGPLTPLQIAAALAAGRARAADYLRRGLIVATAMTLQGVSEVVGGERWLVRAHSEDNSRCL